MAIEVKRAMEGDNNNMLMRDICIRNRDRGQRSVKSINSSMSSITTYTGGGSYYSGDSMSTIRTNELRALPQDRMKIDLSSVDDKPLKPGRCDTSLGSGYMMAPPSPERFSPYSTQRKSTDKVPVLPRRCDLSLGSSRSGHSSGSEKSKSDNNSSKTSPKASSSGSTRGQNPRKTPRKNTINRVPVATKSASRKPPANARNELLKEVVELPAKKQKETFMASLVKSLPNMLKTPAPTPSAPKPPRPPTALEMPSPPVIRVKVPRRKSRDNLLEVFGSKPTKKASAPVAWGQDSGHTECTDMTCRSIPSSCSSSSSVSSASSGEVGPKRKPRKKKLTKKLSKSKMNKANGVAKKTPCSPTVSTTKKIKTEGGGVSPPQPSKSPTEPVVVTRVDSKPPRKKVAAAARGPRRPGHTVPMKHLPRSKQPPPVLTKQHSRTSRTAIRDSLTIILEDDGPEEIW